MIGRFTIGTNRGLFTPHEKDNRMYRTFIVGLLATILTNLSAYADNNWPQFRGSKSLGISEETGLPDTWSTTQNVLWKTDIPGRGWSSPIVWGDRIFLTSVINEGKSEPPKKGLYFGGERQKPPTSVHRWMVYCIDFRTGKILWEKMPHKGVPEGTSHIKNSFASETPVTDGERVYAYFGNLGLFCYDMDGKELWSRKWPAYKTRFGWGTAASPVLYKDRIYIVNDNDQNSFLVAIDKHTGAEVWRVQRDEKSNWATPYIWENEIRTEIVTPGTVKCRSYDLDGHLLWQLRGMSQIAIPMPFSKFGLLYMTSGYVLDKKRPVFAIQPGATGDISLQEGETSNQYIAWSQKQGGPYNPSPLIYGDYFYVLKDRGFLCCFDARTGKEIYHDQRLGATEFTSSPWAYDGKIFCQSEGGDTFVIKAGPKFEILRKNSLNEMCMATPAIVNGSLIIRTETKLYRIGNGVK
jgi:outer membrane protein assembly factor BamB